MKKVKFVCDNCLKVIAIQILTIGELEETHLNRFGEWEICYECMYRMFPNVEFNHTPQKAKITEDDMEIERYGHQDE